MSNMSSTQASTQTCYLQLKGSIKKLHDQHFIRLHLKYFEVVSVFFNIKREGKEC